MNPQQQTFLSEYLRTGDKIEAYCKAYPNVKRTSVKSAANRLLRECPEIEEEVNATRARLKKEVEEEVRQELKAQSLSRERILHLLAITAEGARTYERLFHTKNGFEERDVKPTHSQMLNAINAYIRLEGMAVRQSAKKEKEEPQHKGPVEVYISGLPMAEMGALYDYTVDAYYDKEDGTARYCPDNAHTMERFLEIQKQREVRKDAERDARMTPMLRQEEALALKELQSRPVDDGLYRPHDKLIDELRDAYVADKKEEQLRELKAVQKMCGLRFLPHRHRYEAEHEAGWQFHPLNNNLVRRAPAPSNSSQGGGQEITNCMLSSSSPLGGGQEGVSLKNTPNRQQTATIGTEAMPAHKPDLTGYTYIKEIVDDHWDKYINNQHSGTHKAFNDVVKLARAARDPAEQRAQVEQETGWEYHPQDTRYARRKRHTSNNLVPP